MMRSLVTGGTGFIGSNVVRALLERGNAVRVLARADADRRNLAGLDVEITCGDVRDRASVDRAVSGCDRVFHAAALYSFWAPRPLFEAINVEGTRNVLAAAARARVETVVHTSSVAALGVPETGAVADEDTRAAPADIVGAYKQSKYRAEQVAMEAAARGERVVIVNPSFPVGPGDIKPTPTGRVIVDFLTGRMPAYVDTGMNVVDVRDVAAGHVLAAERGRAGERYILGGENVTMRELLERLAAVSGRRAPRLRIPYAPIFALAGFNEAVCRLTGREPRMTRDTLRMSRHAMFYSPAKAVRELGLPQSPIEAGLSAAVAWFTANGYVRGTRAASSRRTRAE
jgi:dihydroflavonol-4-reductase